MYDADLEKHFPYIFTVIKVENISSPFFSCYLTSNQSRIPHPNPPTLCPPNRDLHFCYAWLCDSRNVTCMTDMKLNHPPWAWLLLEWSQGDSDLLDYSLHEPGYSFTARNSFSLNMIHPCYNMVNIFNKDIHERPPIVCPWGRDLGVFCEFKVFL